MWGPVEITAERLQRIADKYNKARAKPLNDNDYAPILVNHNRDVELLMGRVLADLEVVEWEDPDTGTMGKGLIGTLRVDDPEAIKKVESGKYAQVSMSFDEDDDTLWETSFVAVEAARRSQALEQGDPEMSAELQAQLKASTDKHVALQGQVRESVMVRKAIVLAAGEHGMAALQSITTAAVSLENGLKEFKTAFLKAQFKGLIRTGQLSKAEFDKLNLPEMVSMSSNSIAMLLSSYKSRAVSPHVRQFGQAGAKPLNTGAKLSAAEMREAAKVQRAGKSAALAVDQPTGDGGQGDKGKEKQEEYAEGDDMDDFDGCIKKMGEIEPHVTRAKEFLTKINESLKKLGEQNDKDAA